MWVYQDRELTEADVDGYVGFVYLITNLVDGRFYVGKKTLKFRRTKTVKGRKRRVVVDSDWRDYWSSSDRLRADVVELGESSFERRVLHLCETKSQMTYMEMVEQIERRVLERDDSYNDWICARVRRRGQLRPGFTSATNGDNMISTVSDDEAN
jgi:hypothetical protein